MGIAGQHYLFAVVTCEYLPPKFVWQHFSLPLRVATHFPLPLCIKLINVTTVQYLHLSLYFPLCNPRHAHRQHCVSKRPARDKNLHR